MKMIAALIIVLLLRVVLETTWMTGQIGMMVIRLVVNPWKRNPQRFCHESWFVFQDLRE